MPLYGSNLPPPAKRIRESREFRLPTSEFRPDLNRYPYLHDHPLDLVFSFDFPDLVRIDHRGVLQ